MLDFKFTYYTDLITAEEVEIETINFSGLSFNIEQDPEKLIYRKTLEGDIIVCGNAFNYFKSKIDAGIFSVFGDFYVNNNKIFDGDVAFGGIGGLQYYLDSHSYNEEKKQIKIKIKTNDEYTLIEDNADIKINILESEAERYVTSCYRRRTKLVFSPIPITGGSVFLDHSTSYDPIATNKVYAREMLINATEAEKKTLNGLNGWIISGTALVRDWSYSFRAPTASDYILEAIDYVETANGVKDYPTVDAQGHMQASTIYTQTDEFLDTYTALINYLGDETVSPYSPYFCLMLKNETYYGSESDYKYYLVKNGLNLIDAVLFMYKKVDPNISAVLFKFLDRFEFTETTNLIIQSLSELSRALPYSTTVSGTNISPATKGNLTLNEINRLLRQFLNVYFYVENQNVRYLHYSDYFNLTPIIDLTNTKIGNITPILEKKYNSEERFKIITRNFEAANIDFIGTDIIFDAVLNNTIKNVQADKFYFDINDILTNQDKYAKSSGESWVLMLRKENSEILENEQILSNRFKKFINEKFSVAFIDEKFAVGSDKKALINLKEKEIDTFSYTELIEFDICPSIIFGINPRSYFKTDYSDKHILKKLNLKLDGSPAKINLYV